MDAQMKTALDDQLNFTAFELEDQLDIDMSPVDPQVAQREIDACNEHLEINGAPINHSIMSVPMSAITTLYNAAMALRTDTANFVTGLKMHLTIKDGLVSLLFQPLLMTRPAPPVPIGEPFYNVTAGAFYAYDEATRTVALCPSRDYPVLLANYRNDIRIKHRIDIDFTRFIPDMDTEAIIFPFQTIVALAKDNGSNTIYFHNSIRLEPVGGGYSVKHCLLLSSILLQGNSFKGKYANRSHLCPPSCNSIQYALLV